MAESVCVCAEEKGNEESQMMSEVYKPTGPRIGRAVKTREMEMIKGKLKPKTTYKEYMPTSRGEIEMERWADLAEQEIQENGQQDLYTEILEYLKQYKWLSKEIDRRIWALQCLYYKAYEHWTDFRPEKTIIWM